MHWLAFITALIYLYMCWLKNSVPVNVNLHHFFLSHQCFLQRIKFLLWLISWGRCCPMHHGPAFGLGFLWSVRLIIIVTFHTCVWKLPKISHTFGAPYPRVHLKNSCYLQIQIIPNQKKVPSLVSTLAISLLLGNSLVWDHRCNKSLSLPGKVHVP